MRLIVQYPIHLPVLINQVPRGDTNQVIVLEAGTHHVTLDDQDGTDPAELVVEVGTDTPADSIKMIGFKPLQAPLDRFSPLYCRYNGFVLGQFLGLMFAKYARKDYFVRRARALEFLEEISVSVAIPEQPLDFGSPEYEALLGEILRATAAVSIELTDFALLGAQMSFYPHLEENKDPVARDIAKQIDGLRAKYRLPELDLASLIPTARSTEGTLSIDPVLSRSLEYLGSIIDTLDIEPNTAFVIMPFAPPFSGYFASFYRPSLEQAGFRAFRMWGGLSHEDYCELLLKIIKKVGIAWADISGQNANVIYEVGAAHALEKMVVIVVDEAQAKKVPANVGHDVLLAYAPGSADFPRENQRAISTLIAAMVFAAERGQKLRLRNTDVESALEQISETLIATVIPEEADEALKRARAAMDRGDHATAEKELTAAIEMGKNDGVSFGLRGLVRLRSNPAGAVEDLTRAIEELGENPAIVRTRGLAYDQLDQYQLAEGDFSTVLAADPSDGEAWYFRAAIRAGDQRDTEAESDLNQAIAAGYDEPEVHALLEQIAARR